ncbi:bifunctional phosphoribosylaminoimidazolecarboxamide formyltransferase/IMP cyclohydrolase, partial [mine drainage metagenome]
MASGTGSAVRIERALLSVDDKTGVVDLARGLAEWQVDLWATGGTRAAIAAAGDLRSGGRGTDRDRLVVRRRVKTLHPGLLGGILAPRTAEGRRELAERGLLPFDLVVVNFYPFARHLAEHPDADDREEFVDIGGVTLARAAAKNHAAVAA